MIYSTRGPDWISHRCDVCGKTWTLYVYRPEDLESMVAREGDRFTLEHEKCGLIAAKRRKDE